MKTLGWFLWLKKEELRLLIIEFHEIILTVIACAVITLSGTFIPFIHREKLFIERIALSLVFLILFAFIASCLYLIFNKLFKFLRGNWDKAKKIKADLKISHYCTNCEKNVTANPTVDGVKRSCVCGNSYYWV